MQVRTKVREAMTKPVLVIGPEHTLRKAAQLMAARSVGSAIVIDPDSAGVGIMTERDVLNAIGAGLDPDVERTASHITWEVVYAGPEWTLADAALAMAKGGFRHLVVLEGDDVLGVISVRDIMKVWAHEHAQTPAGAAVG
jgi:signal-transduction protein with cAMP-binding, CBS, and nucleotidyltransferase domain